MIQAVEEWGIFKGFWLGLRRISRCHPWGKSGADPVPKKKARG
jgi:putative component of membrane protein insertase Oxa1/YidC/SpoIIIJ protein YidD